MKTLFKTAIASIALLSTQVFAAQSLENHTAPVLEPASYSQESILGTTNNPQSDSIVIKAIEPVQNSKESLLSGYNHSHTGHILADVNEPASSSKEAIL